MNETTLRRLIKISLVGLCIITFCLLVATSLRDSTTVDELAHIPAGYGYDRYLDYRLNPEHPPLLKAIAAFPLLFLNLQFPTTNPFWTSTVNGEWGVGGAFLFGIGNDAYKILQVARVGPILLTVGLVLLVYFWSKRLMGSAWALAPALMVGLSPLFLGQGHLVTTDVAATIGIVIGLWSFVEYVDRPTTWRFFLAGICLGLGELMKFSVALLFPLFAVLLIFHAVGIARRDEVPVGKLLWRSLGIYVGIVLLGTLFVIYPVYALFTAHYPIAQQAADTANLVGPTAALTCSVTHWTPCLARLDIWAAGHALTRPFAEYLLGLLLTTERVAGTSVSYFLGSVSLAGSPWYFPVVYALKETIPALIIIIAGFVFGFARMIKAAFTKRAAFFRYVTDHFAEFSMILFVMVYWTAAIRSSLDIGIRYLLPAIPLMYILAIGAIRRGPPGGKRAAFVGAMIAWIAAETAFAFPYYISYFNEFGGGVWNGYHYVTDSNYDWGQDMFAFQSFVNAHPEINSIAVDFFGGSNPQYYLGDKYVAWQPSMGDPSQQGIQWIAISINNLQDAIEPAAPGYNPDTSAGYQWLLQRYPKPPGLGSVPTPTYRIGTTIFVYKL